MNELWCLTDKWGKKNTVVTKLACVSLKIPHGDTFPAGVGIIMDILGTLSTSLCALVER